MCVYVCVYVCVHVCVCVCVRVCLCVNIPAKTYLIAVVLQVKHKFIAMFSL